MNRFSLFLTKTLILLTLFIPFHTIFIIQFNFRQAVQAFCTLIATIMDNSQIYDSQLKHRNPSFMDFLDRKKPSSIFRKLSINSINTDIEEQITSKLLPEYRFSIADYSIGDHVEYSVTLEEQYTILRRKIKKNYYFATRYSKLEILDKKVGGAGLPSKKWFGNCNRLFVEKRKVELEAYLNRLAKCRNAAFYRFVKQIKDSNFNKSLKGIFCIE